MLIAEKDLEEVELLLAEGNTEGAKTKLKAISNELIDSAFANKYVKKVMKALKLISIFIESDD